MVFQQASHPFDQGVGVADIYYTSDTHSYLYDTDYIHQGSSHAGYFELARHFEPGSLVIDGGDVLQGSPLARELSKQGFPFFIQAEAMNAAGVKVFVPGNHDFNFSDVVFKRFVSALDATLVCANLVDTSGEIQIAPHYLYVGSDGIRIGVVGVVTDFVNVWEEKRNLGSLRVLDSVESAAKAFAQLVALHCDYTICVYHGGYDDISASYAYQENRSDALAQIGFDVLLTAHQHAIVQPFSLGRTLSLQCGSNAYHYARLACSKEGVDARILKAGEGKVYDHPSLEVVKTMHLDLQERVFAYLATKIGETEEVFEDIGKLESAIHGSRLADFFNQVQLEYTKADISCVSLFNAPRSLGPVVKAGDVVAAYPFPNTLVVIEVRATVLKSALERCASYFSLKEGSIVISDRFLHPKVEHYNYDYYQNLEYWFDVGKKVGERVVRLRYKQFDLLSEADRTLALVMNNYRATGTGGYPWFANCPVVRQYKVEVQSLIFQTFEETQRVAIPPASNFRVFAEKLTNSSKGC